MGKYASKDCLSFHKPQMVPGCSAAKCRLVTKITVEIRIMHLMEPEFTPRVTVVTKKNKKPK